MSSSGFRERGFGPQGRFEGSHSGNHGDDPRQNNNRGFSRGSFNPSRRNDRSQMDMWSSPNPQSFYQPNPHNSPQTWQNRGRFQGNLRPPFRGGSNYPSRGTRGSFPRGTGPGFRFPNGRGNHNQNQSQDYRWRFPYRDYSQQNEKPDDGGPPPLGSEEERRQKITDAVDELKRKLLCNDGTSTEDVNLWDDDFNIPGPGPDDEGTPKGIPELRHGPPEITLTTSDLKDIGRVDIEPGQKSTNTDENDPDCEIIDVAKSVKTFSEITIHDTEESPMDLLDNKNSDPQTSAQENLIEDREGFVNDEGFLEPTGINNFGDDFDIPPLNDGNTLENEPTAFSNPSSISPALEVSIEASKNEEKSAEPSKSKDDVQNSSHPPSISPSPVDKISPHPFELPQRKESSPDNFIERPIPMKPIDDNRKKSRSWLVEVTPESLPNSKSPIIDSRESSSLQKSARNLNFPQKITANISGPPKTSFTPPLVPNRAPQIPEYNILQPPPVFDPRKKSRELQIGNLMPDFNVMCPRGYSIPPPIINLGSMDYSMRPGYNSMPPYVPMNYPPVIPSLDYPTPLAPPPLSSNMNTNLKPNLNQIPMPPNPAPAGSEDDAFRELKKAMEFAQEIMGMGDTDEINFQKECENGFDNFPTLPDLPPPLPPLPVPPAEEESPKKSKLKKKKKKRERTQEFEGPQLPSVSSLLSEVMATSAAPSVPATHHSPSPSATSPRTMSITSPPRNISTTSPSRIIRTTSPPRTITATPPIIVKREIVSPTKEDRPKVTFNLSLQSKKLAQSYEWRDQGISPVVEAEAVIKPATVHERIKPPPVAAVEAPEPIKKTKRLEKQIGKSDEKSDNPSSQDPKKQLPTLDLMDLLKFSQFETLNSHHSSFSLSSRPSYTPEPSETLSTPSTSSKKPQETTWKDRVIGRFLKMSKNDIKNMINNSNLRKFDIAMQHLVKEKKSSLSMEMRNTEDEKIKSKDNIYDKEDFIHQLKQILDPAATVDISDLPTNFIHQLNEVLQLDVVPQDDNTDETTLSNQETTNTPKIDQLHQNESSQTFGINAPVISTGDTFKLGKIDKRASKDTTKSLATCSDSIVHARRAKRCKNSALIDNNQSNQLNHQFNSPDSSLSSHRSVSTEAGALIMDELDDIFSAGINRARMITKTTPQNVKQSSAFGHNYGNNYATNSIITRIETPIVDRVDRIFNTGIAKAKAASKSEDQRIMRSRKDSSDLDFFRNLTKEEYDARYGESSHSSHDNPYRIMNPKHNRKFNDQFNGERDQDALLKTYPHSPRFQNNYDGHSSDGITSDEFDSASSSGSSDDTSDEPSIDVSRMLRFIKEREKMAKKKSLNEEIRDEVTAEIERKRKEKRAHKASRSKKKDRKVKRRKDKHHKNRKKKRRRNHYSGGEENSSNRSLPLLTEQEIKKEPRDDELDRQKEVSPPQIQRKKPLIGPKSVMAKAALIHQEESKASTIHSPSILGVKPTHQPKLSVINSVSGADNPSPTTASPSRNSPARSSPINSSSTNFQITNPFLKTKAQLKQMPEGMKKTSERPGGAVVFNKGLARKGPSTPPLQVRPISELLGKNSGVDPEKIEPPVTVKVENCQPPETVNSPKPVSSPVSSTWGQLQSSTTAGFGKTLGRLETRSPLTISEPSESARFTFLQRNKIVEEKGVTLAPFIPDNAISLRMTKPQETSQQTVSGTTLGASGVEGAKSTSKLKKLNFKAYQERALERKLRAEGKLPPLLEKVVPSEDIQKSEDNQLSEGSKHFIDSVPSTVSSPPVLVKEIITKNDIPSGEVKLLHKQKDKMKTPASAPKEKLVDQPNVVKKKVAPPAETKTSTKNDRSAPPGPLSSKRRKSTADTAKNENNVSSPAAEPNTSTQAQKSADKPGILEQEKASKKGKVSIKKQGHKFSFYFRLCKSVISDGPPDIVPVESLPEAKSKNTEASQEETSKERGNIPESESFKDLQNPDSVEKLAISEDMDNKSPEACLEPPEVIDGTLNSEEPGIFGVLSVKPSESLKSLFEISSSTHESAKDQESSVVTINTLEPTVQSEMTPEPSETEAMKSLDQAKSPVELNPELHVSKIISEVLQTTEVHPQSSDITSHNPISTTHQATESQSENMDTSPIAIPDESLGIQLSEPLKSPLNAHETVPGLQDEALPSESFNLPREIQNSSIENLKDVDLNESNDLASLSADEASWRVDPDHLDQEDLHNPQNIPDSKEEEVSFTESHTNWQLEAEMSTEEARKNVVLHDRALVVDTPRNSLLDDPITFATTNNSPSNEGEVTDEFGILCENDIQGSIYDNQLAESSPIDMINDSSLPLRTSFTPDNELVDGLNNDEDLAQVNEVAIVVRELMEVGRKASPERLPSLILQGMIREVEEDIKTPDEEEEGEGIVITPGEDIKVSGDDKGTNLYGESAGSHGDTEKPLEIAEDIDKTLAEVEDDIKSLQEADRTVNITEGDDKTLEEAEEDIKALQEADEKDTQVPGGHETPHGSVDATTRTTDEFVPIPEPEVEPEMQILAPEDVEHSLNSLVTEESPTSQSTETPLLKSPRLDDSSPVTEAPTSLGNKEAEQVSKPSISNEEKPEKILDQQDEKLKTSDPPKNLQNSVDINSSSSSRLSPALLGPSSTLSGLSPTPEIFQTEEKAEMKDSILEKSKDRHSKKQKDIDAVKKLNKVSKSTREHKKHKHHDKKKSKITEKRVEEMITSNIVAVSQPTTKIGVMARMREIDIAIQNLMNEKMTLYQMLQNDEWPIPQVDAPQAEQLPIADEKTKVKSNNSGEQLNVKKTPKVIPSRLVEGLENKQSNILDTSSSKSVPSEVAANDTTKPQKNSKNEEKRLGNWEDKIPHKARKRGHSKDKTEVVKAKEAKREGSTDSSLSKTSDDSINKKDKKFKTVEESVKKPVKLSQLIARDFKPKPSPQKNKSSTLNEEKGRENRSKSLEKSSTKHKNVSSHVENNEKHESSEINPKTDEKKKKKSSNVLSDSQSLPYSDDSTLDSADRITSDLKKATGLALLEESMKREVGIKKKQDSKKLKETIADDDEDDIDFPKSISVKKHSQKKTTTHGKKSTISEPPEDPQSAKHLLEVIDAVAKNRTSNVHKLGVPKKHEKTEKISEEVKKKVKDDPKKSQDSKIETKPQKKMETKLNLIDSDSSDNDGPNHEDSTASSDVRNRIKTPSKHLEDSSDEKEKEKETKELKKPEKSLELKSLNLKAAILDDWSDSSSSSSSKRLQRDKKISKSSKSIIDDSEDELKESLESEKHHKSKPIDIKSSKPLEKPAKRPKSVMSDKSKSTLRDSDRKLTSKESEKIISPSETEKSFKDTEKSKKDEGEKPQISSRAGDDSPIEGDDEDEEISTRRKGTSRRSKKVSSRKTNKSSSRSRSTSKRALRSSSRDSTPEIERVKKRPRSGSSTSSIHHRRKSFTSRTEPLLSKHKRRQQHVEMSREEMMNCRVKLIDCKYLFSLRPENHPQTFRRFGISRINPCTHLKCMVLSDEKSRSEDDYQPMIVVEVDDNVGSSSAVELIEEGMDHEDKMSEKSVCLGFPLSPKVDQLTKSRREEVLDGIEETEVLERKERDGVSEGDVELIDIKEEPITTVDSSTEEGCGNGGDEVEKQTENNEEKAEIEDDYEKSGDGKDKVGDEDRDRMRYSAHKGPILDIKIFGDSFLAASEDGAIYRYSQKSNGILNIYKGHEAAVTCLYVHEIPGITESKKWFLFSGSLDASLRCYDVMGGLLNRPKVTVGSPIQCMDEAWGSIFIGTKSGHISRYDIKTGSLREDKLDFSDKPVLALRASTEGVRKILIVASRNQPITIRDAQSGLFLRTIAGQRTHTVYSLMRDKNLVYCGTSSTSIPVFDFISGDQVTQYTAGVGIVCMRLYQQLLFAGCYDGNIYVFDTKEPKLICSIPGPGNMLLSMEIIDETIIAGSKDRHLHAWRMPPSVRSILLERT